MFKNIICKFIRWLDPKLDRFRPTKPVAKPAKYTPRTLEDFIGVLQRTPKSILSSKDRDRIAAVMSFDERTVAELMIPKSKMIFIKNTEILGPLVLDKLFKSGFTNFPVVDSREHIKGIIHTEALNALEIKHTDRADKYMTTEIHFLKSTDSLTTAIAHIERDQSYYFLVRDDHDQLVGFFTIQLLLDYLLGK